MFIIMSTIILCKNIDREQQIFYLLDSVKSKSQHNNTDNVF